MVGGLTVDTRVYETVFLAVQGVGAVVLAWFTFDSIGQAGARLAFAEFWSAGLAISGLLALALAISHRLRSEVTWSATASVMAASMLGRGLDIWWRIDEFAGRPALAVAIWIVSAFGVATAWVVVGAVTEALEHEGR